MATIKEIKQRIKSIKNTSKIAKAMELISTIKMKKAQDLVMSKKEFVKEIFKIFLRIEKSLSDFSFFKKGKGKKTLGVCITSNKGLCGGYNLNIMKKINSYVKSSGETVDFVGIGKKGVNFLGRTGNNLIADFSLDFNDNLETNSSKRISRFLLEKFSSGEYSKIIVFYNHYINTIKQIPTAKEFLPISKDHILEYFKNTLGEEFKNQEIDIKYEIEPSKEVIIKDILPMIFDMIFFDFLIESKASEHSSRMIAMKNAKDNSNKYTSKLTMFYNKIRQALITKEISELVSGVESTK